MGDRLQILDILRNEIVVQILRRELSIQVLRDFACALFQVILQRSDVGIRLGGFFGTFAAARVFLGIPGSEKFAPFQVSTGITSDRDGGNVFSLGILISPLRT